MTSTAPQPKPTTDAWGIDASWLDAHDDEHTVAAATITRLREVIGTPPDDLVYRVPIVARPGDALEVDAGRGRVRGRRDPARSTASCPRTSRSATTGCAPPDGRERRLIVSPGRCWLPEGWRAWGWAVQLYAAAVAVSWGIGDLGDLRTRARVGPGAGRRLRAGQPAARRRADAPAGGQPLPAGHPALPQPALPARRRRARRGRGRRRGRAAGPRAQRRRAHRPGRRLGAQAPRRCERVFDAGARRDGAFDATGGASRASR